MKILKDVDNIDLVTDIPEESVQNIIRDNKEYLKTFLNKRILLTCQWDDTAKLWRDTARDMEEINYV